MARQSCRDIVCRRPVNQVRADFARMMVAELDADPSWERHVAAMAGLFLDPPPGRR